MTKETVKPRRGRGKADAQLAANELTAERIQIIFGDPSTKKGVRQRLTELIQCLHEESGNCALDDTPELRALSFKNGAAGLHCLAQEKRANVEPQAVYDEIARLTEEHEPRAYKVARRCTEIYYDWLGRKQGRKHADGAFFFVEHVDAVLEGGDGLLPNPGTKHFTPLFVEAFDERGPRDRHVRSLLDLIKRVDEGADLNKLRDEAERAFREHAEARRPKDARLVSALSAILRDPKTNAGIVNRLGYLMCELSNETHIDDLHPDVFETLARVYIREARKGAAVKVGQSDRARKAWLRKHPNEPRPWQLQKHLVELEDIAGE